MCTESLEHQAIQEMNGVDALVVIDVQEWIVSLDLFPVTGQKLAHKIENMVEKWRELYPNKPVVWIAFLRADGSDGGLDGRAGLSIRKADDEALLIKYGISAFQGTRLHHYLSEHDVRSFITVGIATDYAIAATALDAIQHGYQVWVPADGCVATSAYAHKKTLEKLSERGVCTKPYGLTVSPNNT
ncbi:cysteine hydrolase family protein [Corynebacterium sp. sy039]|uniref:cysteine hydrolase family protein n=1 Tax=Corynebacterium sp. sy039 TaxID=2599641 RepID=UPI0011B48834|nr:isochorismatase family cysteine hydrolase [Corynebacterium sp. sy039]QDZ42716.1 cysteine hydrolase [Corynebacterium sp. sy039]